MQIQGQIPSLERPILQNNDSTNIRVEMASEIDEWHYSLNGFSKEEIICTQLQCGYALCECKMV
jgi:hypothetical protein